MHDTFVEITFLSQRLIEILLPYEFVQSVKSIIIAYQQNLADVVSNASKEPSQFDAWLQAEMKAMVSIIRVFRMTSVSHNCACLLV